MILSVKLICRTINKVCTINEHWRELQFIDRYFGIFQKDLHYLTHAVRTFSNGAFCSFIETPRTYIIVIERVTWPILDTIKNPHVHQIKILK